MRQAVWLLVLGLSGCMVRHSPEDRVRDTRLQLEGLYEQNRQAFLRKDLGGIMALRTADFHSRTPDGQHHDAAWMRQYIEGLLNGIQSWNELTFTIDSLAISGDTARAIVSQYADRRALRPDNQYHQVQTWVTQRETWLRTTRGWLLWRVDDLRGQRRLVDGREGE